MVQEQVSEILHSLTVMNPHLLKDYKKDILEVFSSDDFFNCNVSTLRIWSKMIDMFLDETKTDVLTEYFDK